MAKSEQSALKDQTSEQAYQVDVRAVMAEIRARVKDELGRGREKKPALSKYAAELNGGATRKAGELLHSEDLRYLNTHYNFAPALKLEEVTSHRGGFIASFIVKCKRKVLAIVWDHLLRDYFLAEREYQTNLVRYLNDVSKYVDARDASNFWELIKKVDYDITKALQRIEQLADEQSAALRSTERSLNDDLYGALRELSQRLSQISSSTERHEAGLKTLDGVARGLEGIVARFTQPGTAKNLDDTPTEVVVPAADYSYVLLENRFRGSEAQISERLEIYPPLFRGMSLPVLEIGAGRGELQELFKKARIPSYGIDIDAAMVETSKEKGFDVRLEDCLAHLRSLPSRSLGGVIAVQVVEHLSREQLKELFTLCADRVTKGGTIIFETINPQSLLALSSNYFRDPTHVFPCHPDTLAFSMSLCGLEIAEVRYLSPVPEGAKLKSVMLREFMTPRWKEVLETLNHNIEQLNGLLYGYQDFCIVARAK